MKQPLRLVRIGADGTSVESLDSLPEVAREACAATTALYDRVGFDPPWTGYLALSGPDVVGTCAFKTGPRLGKVEIAYYTFPPFEGQGIATAMARALIEIARTADRTMELTAQTLPEPNASNAILRKLGFQFVGAVDVPDEGAVWEWRLSPI
ncbi:MAG TPA: GNAT family N-acetyltransferase [Chthoniobacterales bacterium]|nr:GNAT family N-acetyltransferase [Chthoniobacterales bacterium]